MTPRCLTIAINFVRSWLHPDMLIRAIHADILRIRFPIIIVWLCYLLYSIPLRNNKVLSADAEYGFFSF